MAKTYMWLQDINGGNPQKDTTPVSFDVYNEAMSYAKWASLNDFEDHVYAYVWNFDGGSGYWNDGTFHGVENNNYPS